MLLVLAQYWSWALDSRIHRNPLGQIPKSIVQKHVVLLVVAVVVAAAVVVVVVEWGVVRSMLLVLTQYWSWALGSRIHGDLPLPAVLIAAVVVGGGGGHGVVFHVVVCMDWRISVGYDGHGFGDCTARRKWQQRTEESSAALLLS